MISKLNDQETLAVRAVTSAGKSDDAWSGPIYAVAQELGICSDESKVLISDLLNREIIKPTSSGSVLGERSEWRWEKGSALSSPHCVYHVDGLVPMVSHTQAAKDESGGRDWLEGWICGSPACPGFYSKALGYHMQSVGEQPHSRFSPACFQATRCARHGCQCSPLTTLASLFILRVPMGIAERPSRSVGNSCSIRSSLTRWASTSAGKV